MSSAVTHVLLPADSPGMESDTYWHLYDDWQGEFLSVGGVLNSGEAGLHLLTPTMLTAIGELYAVKAFRFQQNTALAQGALDEVRPQLPAKKESPYIDPFLWVRRGLLPADWPLRFAYRTRVLPVIEPGLRTCFELVLSDLSVKGQHVHLDSAGAKAGNCNWCLTEPATYLVRSDYLFHALCGDCFRREKDVFEPLRKIVKPEDLPTPEKLKLPAEEVTGSIVTGCIPNQKTFELRQPAAAEWKSPISLEQRAADFGQNSKE